MHLLTIRILLILLSGSIIYGSVFGQDSLPEGFTIESLPLELSAPVGLDFDNNGDMYLWEKTGLLWYVSQENDFANKTLVLDITEEVGNFGDHGLIDFAFDPDFESNGLVYLYYVVDRYYMERFGEDNYDPAINTINQASIGRITQFKINKNDNAPELVADSRKVILGKTYADGLPILMQSHGVGSIVFGQDKTLLVSFGDGGSFTESDLGNANDTYHAQAIADGSMTDIQNIGAFRAMLKSSPNGKVLRINKETGEGIPSNPFYDPTNSDNHESRIWAMGFRNPFKMIKLADDGSHDPTAGDPGTMLVGDVGSSNWEELNIVNGGGKWYGWPLFEGYAGKYDFQIADISNPELILPDGCNTPLLFKQQFSEERLDRNYSKLVHCDNSELATEDQYIHLPPILAYSNDKWNKPAKTRTRIFNADGISSSASINENDTTVSGDIIAGGSVIPGGINHYDLFPDEYLGRLFVADFHGFIYSFELDENFQIINSKNFYTSDDKGITDLKFNPADGALYLTDIMTKEVKRIGFGGMLPPLIKYDLSQNYGQTPFSVRFDATQTISRTNTALEYNWTFEDGSQLSGAIIEKPFIGNARINENVVLTITDEFDLSAAVDIPISLNNTPPKVIIALDGNPKTYSIESYNVFELKATVSDQEHENEKLDYAWRVDLYHDEHFHEGPVDRTVESFAILDGLGCGLESYYYKIILDVTDPLGLVGHDEQDVLPYCGEAIADFFNLSATQVDGGVALDWQIENERDLVSFSIEKTDEYLFKKLQAIPFEGSGKIYQIIDKSPYAGENFYRIKAIDSKGDFSYSNVVSVSVSSPIDINIFPNRTDNYLNVVSNASSDLFPITYSISNLNGKILMKNKILSCHSNQSCAPTIDVSKFATGAYFISFDLGETAITKRFLKF